MSNRWITVLLGLLLVTVLIAGGIMWTRLQERIENLEQEVQELRGEKARLSQELQKARRAEVTVYFVKSLPTEFVLVPVKRQVAREQNMPKAAMEELLAGPAPGSELLPSVPPGTKLRDLQIEERMAVVDLSREVIDNFNGGARMEWLLLAAIANTLTEFPQIDSVQILVDGEKVESIGGHVEADRPIERDEEVVLWN